MKIKKAPGAKPKKEEQSISNNNFSFAAISTTGNLYSTSNKSNCNQATNLNIGNHMFEGMNEESFQSGKLILRSSHQNFNGGQDAKS